MVAVLVRVSGIGALCNADVGLLRNRLSSPTSADKVPHLEELDMLCMLSGHRTGVSGSVHYIGKCCPIDAKKTTIHCAMPSSKKKTQRCGITC